MFPKFSHKTEPYQTTRIFFSDSRRKFFHKFESSIHSRRFDFFNMNFEIFIYFKTSSNEKIDDAKICLKNPFSKRWIYHFSPKLSESMFDNVKLVWNMRVSFILWNTTPIESRKTRERQSYHLSNVQFFDPLCPSRSYIEIQRGMCIRHDPVFIRRFYSGLKWK